MMHLLLVMRGVHIFTWLLLLTLISVTKQVSRNPLLEHDMQSDSSIGSKCSQNATCQALDVTSCLDVTLPYKHTSLHPAFSNQSEVREYLSRFEGLRKVPRCWTAFESIICTTFLPRCDDTSNGYFLPTQDMCRNARSHCRLIHPLINQLCSNESLFPSNCPNLYMDLKFANPSPSKCPGPLLVATEDSSLWFKGIEGCAFHCSDHRFSEKAKKVLELVILSGSVISLAISGLSCLTYTDKWRYFRERYPSVTVFYIYFCIGIVYLTFLIQFILLSKESIACKSDGTVRHSVPASSDHNGPCIWTAALLYYFGMAGLIWFVIFAIDLSRYYDLHKEPGSPKERQRRHNRFVTYYQLFAWAFPLICLIFVHVFNGVDGSFTTGVCFVGLNDWGMRTTFVLTPITAAVFIGEYFLIRTLMSLSLILKTTQLKDQSSKPLKSSSSREREDVRRKWINILVIAIGIVCLFGVMVFSNIIEFIHSDSWLADLENRAVCSLNVSDVSLPDSSVAATEGYSCSDDNGSSEGTTSMGHILAQISCVFVIAILFFVTTWKSCAILLRSWILKLLRAPGDDEYIRKDVIIGLAKGVSPEQVKRKRDKFNLRADPAGFNQTPIASDELSDSFRNQLEDAICMRAAENGKTEGIRAKTSRRVKAFFKRSRSLYDADASSVSETVYGSQDATGNNYSVASDTRSTSRLSLKETQELQEFISNKRKHMRHPRKQNSDPATQSLASTSFMLPAARSVSQSILNVRQQEQQANQAITSQNTGQHTMPQSLDPLQMFVFYQNLLSRQPPTPSLPTAVSGNLVVTSQQNNNVLLSSLQCNQSTFNNEVCGSSRVTKQVQQQLQGECQRFSHGMIEHKEHLTNPLLEKRKPDSKVHYLQQNEFPISFANFSLGIMNPQQPNLFQPQHFNLPFGLNFTPNPFLQPHLFPSNFGMTSIPQPSAAFSFTQSITNPLLNPSLMFNPTASLPNQIRGNISNNLAVIQQTVEQDVNNAQSPIDLQLMNRQRKELDCLMQAMDSGSEVCSNIIPGVSDSEGFFTDGGEASGFTAPSKKNNSNQMIKQEVEERIQRIEAAVAADSPSKHKLDVNRNEKEEQKLPVASNTVFQIPSDRRPKSLEETSSHHRSKKRSSSFKKYHKMKKR